MRSWHPAPVDYTTGAGCAFKGDHAVVDTYLEGFANGQGVNALLAVSVRDIIFWTSRKGPRHPGGLHSPKVFALATQSHARERHSVGFHDLLGVSCCASSSVLRLHAVGNHQSGIRTCAHAQHNRVTRSHTSLSLILVLRRHGAVRRFCACVRVYRSIDLRRSRTLSCIQHTLPSSQMPPAR